VLEYEAGAFFADFLQLLGLSPSVAQIYGLLYCREEELSFEEVQQVLGISQGSTSQGLRYLQARGMVRAVEVAGLRHKKFLAETALGKIVQSLLKEQVSSRLESGRQRLAVMSGEVAQRASVPSEVAERVQRLDGWTKRAQELLPMMVNLAGGT
jgi:DNA-binding transcriptional regulator GbsR (MarR family)